MNSIDMNNIDMNNIDRNAIFLDEIGVGPLWTRRTATTTATADLTASAISVASALPVVADTPEMQPIVAQQPSVRNTPAQGPSAWNDNDSPTSEEPVADRHEDRPKPTNDVMSMDWRQLKSAVAGCKKCGLCEKRTNTVFGVGDEKAKWLFIGEGPGRNEDAQGEPFVGPAGKLLDNMLRALGLKRGENAYIANIVKCRPTDNNRKDRPPTPEEADACMPYLLRQIALIQPTVIVALGKTAAISLLKRDATTAVSSLRGSIHRYAGLPLIVTYHPAYLLRSLADKSKAWVDLCMAMKVYDDLTDSPTDKPAGHAPAG